MGLRIIGGEKKGRKLLSVKGRTTRPTADRMRESLFNILSTRVIGSNVIDLYAGTGALGLEALSRGAATAVFIDNNRNALSVIKQNIQTCDFGKQSNIIKWNILINLKCLEAQARCFDLVFMDPPYDTQCVHQTIVDLKHSNALNNGAMIVVEHSPEEEIPEEFLEFEIIDKRRYGRTLFSFLIFTNSTEKG